MSAKNIKSEKIKVRIHLRLWSKYTDHNETINTLWALLIKDILVELIKREAFNVIQFICKKVFASDFESFKNRICWAFMLINSIHNEM